MANHAVVKDASINPPSLYFGAYQEINDVVALSGAVSGSVPVKITRQGRIVTVTFNSWTLTTSSSGIINGSAVLATYGLIPAQSVDQITRCTYGANQGLVRITAQSSSGDFLFTASATNATYGVILGQNFPNATALTVPAVSIVYSL